MTIVHVITTIAFGGAEKQLLILCRSQIHSGLRVIVVHLKGPEDLKEELQALGVEVKSDCHNKNVLTQIKNLRKIVSRIGNPFLVHSHLPQAELISSFLPKSAKVVITRHFGGNFYPNKPVLFSKILSRFATRKAKAVIAISLAVASSLEKNRELKSKLPVAIVYYGYDRKLVDFERTPLSSDMLKIITIARLSEEKDLFTLLKAISKLYNNYKLNLKLDIFGIGKLEKELKEYCKIENIEKVVMFKGKHPDPISQLLDSDLFVLTSKFEGFGMVLLEAMDAHIPIIAAENSGIREVIDYKGAGEYFRTGDVEHLVQKIWNFSKEKRNNHFVSEQNNRLKYFSSQKMEHNVRNVYNQVLDER